jgi:hypothetical protein
MSPEKYLLSILRFTIDTGTIPVFITSNVNIKIDFLN